MTLGAFTGYFRNRQSVKNATYAYGDYSGHFVLGVLYSRAEAPIDQLQISNVSELENLPSVVRDLQFFAQPKYRIGIDRPGSGNTKNIGSVSTIAALVNGTGPFAALGEEVFDDYWMYYLTSDMTRAADLSRPPYRNLATYLEYKQIPQESSE